VVSQELVDRVVRTFDAWNRGDLDAWLETAHPEIERHSERTQRIEGAETAYRGASRLRRYWEDWHSLCALDAVSGPGSGPA
jgi:hypothetical protein